MTVNLFYDLEFTRLAKDSELISIAFVADNGAFFYAESNEWDREKAIKANPFLIDHVIPHLMYDERVPIVNVIFSEATKIKNCRLKIARALHQWLGQFGAAELWGDVQAYDVMHLHDLFGGAMEFQKMNPHVYYIPFDLSTRFKERRIDPDVSREALAGVLPEAYTMNSGKTHNALYDAYVIRACFNNTILTEEQLNAEVRGLYTK
jgi:hypothetical protein